MFTGIIPAMGSVVRMRNTKRGRFITIEVDTKIARKVSEGGSVSVDGVCLTALRGTSRTLTFELMDSTLKLTALGALKDCNRVNVEPAMRANDIVGGHFVSGHVDGVGVIKRMKKKGQTCYMGIAFPHDLIRYIVSQGSIAVNGVSLTVVEVTKDYFSVALTSHTIKHTNLGELEVGNNVNIEVDMFAKYIFKFLNHYATEYAKIPHRRGKV